MKTRDTHGVSRGTMWLGGRAGPLPNVWTAAKGGYDGRFGTRYISHDLRIIQGGASQIEWAICPSAVQ